MGHPNNLHNKFSIAYLIHNSVDTLTYSIEFLRVKR